MSIADALVLALVVAAVVAVAVLVAWSTDRRGHRRLIGELGNRWGPEGSRAAGEAWRSIAGDGPPTMRVRARGLAAEAGENAKATTAHHDGSSRGADTSADEPASVRPID